ncbi:MAG: SURF1 family protein [Rhodobacteraceae bacterium]|nr:SURF1 family protein [Paracoccaceae bacterium]MCF8513719.1 SURF1 family protein [Paracoccaceae bacterium]MCF8517964.1 SURF1 family protein [Paracoccaceae bacterium]
MTKRMILPLIFGLVGAAILIGLGVWQLQRLAWKEGILAEIDARIQADPVALPEAPSKEADQYLPVMLDGVFTGEGLDVLVSRKQLGAGYRVIAVMETQGRRVLVDRGFMLEEYRAEPRPDAAAGVITVRGNLLWPDEVDGYTPAPDEKTGIWFARELPAMAKALGTEPVLVVQWAATLEDPSVDPMPVDTINIPNDHFGYAIQWFGLAAVWLGMTAYLLWRIRRKTV